MMCVTPRKGSLGREEVYEACTVLWKVDEGPARRGSETLLPSSMVPNIAAPFSKNYPCSTYTPTGAVDSGIFFAESQLSLMMVHPVILNPPYKKKPALLQ